jgi:hypothetical protein
MKDDEAQTYQCSICESDWGADNRAAVRCCSKPQPAVMKDDLREAVMAALTCLEIDNGEGGKYRLFELLDFSGENQTRIVIRTLADAAIAAARPVIGEECAKVADAARETWQKAADKLDGNEVLRNHAAAAETIAANIRSATQNAHRPLDT